MNTVLEKIRKLGIVPVVVLNEAEDAAPVAQALCEGGLPVAEVTFRTEAAEESIRIMKQKFPQMLVGAGTVLTIEQAQRAIDAGAEFIVSPGFNPKVVAYCQEMGVPMTPGCNNPSAIEGALEMGLEVVKFFPAEASGGLKAIKAMAAPYSNIKFMPTGGINEKNINEYLAFPKIIACGGSWMVSGELVKNKEFDKIKELTRQAVMTVLGFELKHVGINCENESEADKAVKAFSYIFGFEKKDGNSSMFAGSFIEAMKTPYLGEKGHIAIGTNNIERAADYLTVLGVQLDSATEKYKNGKLIAVYLKDEIAGFAVHLVQK